MDMMTASHLSARAQDDFSLVQAAIGGDQKAYAALLDRYRMSVFAHMMRMVNSRTEADDLTIEAFEKAFRNLHNYAPRFSFSTWLFKIAINNAIDNLRRRRLRLHSLDNPISPGAEVERAAFVRSTSRTPEEDLVRLQQFRLLHDMIDELSSRYRLMVELRYFEDLSYEEIATELAIPLGTVKAQLFRAKELLYSKMQSERARDHFETTRRREDEPVPGESLAK